MRGTKGTEICDGERNMFPLGVTADGEKLHLAVAAGKETCRDVYKRQEQGLRKPSCCGRERFLEICQVLNEIQERKKVPNVYVLCKLMGGGASDFCCAVCAV